jgi:uncharacterized membrane protein
VSEAYLWWKTAHVIASTILFGGGIVIAFFCWCSYRLALRSDDIGALRAVLRLTVIADAVLTAPAVVFQPLSGLVMMGMLGLPWSSPWALSVAALFVLTGACWLPVVWLQIRLHREAQAAPSMAALSPVFHRRFRCWFALGVPAFAAVLLLFYLMVAKPLAMTAG